VLQILTAETGSLLLALAFVEGQVSPADAFEAAQVDEEFKAGLYNEDKYGRAPDTEKHQKSLRLSLQAAHDFLDAL
jgi:chaperone required for assembly of F1-ATPase